MSHFLFYKSPDYDYLAFDISAKWDPPKEFYQAKNSTPQIFNALLKDAQLHYQNFPNPVLYEKKLKDMIIDEFEDCLEHYWPTKILKILFRGISAKFVASFFSEDVLRKLISLMDSKKQTYLKTTKYPGSYCLLETIFHLPDMNLDTVRQFYKLKHLFTALTIYSSRKRDPERKHSTPLNDAFALVLLKASVKPPLFENFFKEVADMTFDKRSLLEDLTSGYANIFGFRREKYPVRRIIDSVESIKILASLGLTPSTHIRFTPAFQLFYKLSNNSWDLPIPKHLKHLDHLTLLRALISTDPLIACNELFDLIRNVLMGCADMAGEISFFRQRLKDILNIHPPATNYIYKNPSNTMKYFCSSALLHYFRIPTEYRNPITLHEVFKVLYLIRSKHQVDTSKLNVHEFGLNANTLTYLTPNVIASLESEYAKFRRWKTRKTVAHLFTAIGQRDRPKTSKSICEEASKDPVITGEGKREAELAACLFHLRVSRSRGAEVVSPNGRKVISFL